MPPTQEADLFFSDVVNFTETTDKLESEDLTNLLNRYLTEMTNIALEPKQEPIEVKGFAEPVRCYKVLGLYDASAGTRDSRGNRRLQAPARLAEARQDRDRRGSARLKG